MNRLRTILNKTPLLGIYHLFLAWLGNLIYRWPSRQIFIAGITGTKGKSTTIELLNFILEAADKKTALLSSVRIKVGEESENNLTGNTMPGRFFIQKFLRQAVNSGCQYALIEVTSEGAAMHRHRFLDWDAAVFLNLAPEHIEAHSGFEKYREAKLSFFQYAAIKEIRNRDLESSKKSKIKLFVVNKDDNSSNYFIDAARGGETVFFEKSELESRLIGEFNKYNVGAAVAVAEKLGISYKVIEKAVSEFSGVAGRMEFVQKEPFAIVIDYAHTPDSLFQVYETLRGRLKLSASKLIGVLGAAGGGRDKWKRPEMGRIAAQFCDEIILTDEDPYDEQPEKIIDEIEKGVRENPKFNAQGLKIGKILDRKEAIRAAIKAAQAGDIIVITGKGSERFIRISNSQKIPWSDKEVVVEILEQNL